MRHTSLAIAFFVAITLTAPTHAAGTLDISAAQDFTTVLKQAKANRVRVALGLKSGATFKGHVHSIAGSRVVLENLELRDYFSVTLYLPEVVSIEVRTRGD